MNVWVMKHLPGKKNSYDFCRQEGIVGVGWAVDATGPFNSIDDYMTARKVENKFPDNNYLEKTFDLFRQFRKGDLVWLKDKKSVYYLCEIRDGQYQYRKDEEHEKADIISFMTCDYYPIDSARLIPLKIITRLNGRYFTIAKITERLAIEASKCFIRILKRKENK